MHAELDAKVMTDVLKRQKTAVLGKIYGHSGNFTKSLRAAQKYGNECFDTNRWNIECEFGVDTQNLFYDFCYRIHYVEKCLEHQGYLPAGLVSKGVVAGRTTGPRIQSSYRSQSSYQAHRNATHLRQWQEYGKQGYRLLENGRIRYYDEIMPAQKVGEMAGRRRVREWDPKTGNKRTWHETLDHEGNVRQVRPVKENGTKTHYLFDARGNLIREW